MDSRAEATSDAPSPSAHVDDPPEGTATLQSPEDGSPAQPPAFRVLFRAEFGGIVALARLLGSDDPENTAQEAFLRLHTRWASLRDPAAALAYLRTTVVRLARNRVRHLTVVRRHAAAAPPGEHPSAESDALQQADIQAVRSALDRLTARRRAALVLRYYAELPYQEIATALRCPAATARSHVRRGLAELAHLLGEPNEPENKDGGERS